jgi:flap endonuclease-1
MGAKLAQLLPLRRLRLEELAHRSFAVDASNEIYQFLALVRDPLGRPLTDARGNVTSHLVGLLMRTSRLIADFSLSLVYVFDGPPSPLKRRSLLLRKRARERALREWAEALERKDYASAWSKAVVSSSLTPQIVHDAKRLLELMGLPVLEAPEEAEAQAAHLAIKGLVWAVATKDFDALLYGAPRQVRYLTLYGSEWLPSKGRARRLRPELFELERVLECLRLTREQLIDVAILTGTDFNEGIEGVGPKTALSLIRRYGSLEALPQALLRRLGEEAFKAKEAYMRPNVRELVPPPPRPPDERGLYEFLCEQRGFSRERVDRALARLKEAWARRSLWA